MEGGGQESMRGRWRYGIDTDFGGEFRNHCPCIPLDRPYCRRAARMRWDTGTTGTVRHDKRHVGKERCIKEIFFLRFFRISP